MSMCFAATSRSISGSKAAKDDLKQLEAYGKNLLRDEPLLNVRGPTVEGSSEEEEEFGTSGERYGCREAVEVLTRNPKKGSISEILSRY